MSNYTITTTVNQPHDDAVAAVREALGEQGFAVLTEIDLKATLKDKLDVDVHPQVILGVLPAPAGLRSHPGRAIDRGRPSLQRGRARP